MCLKLSLGLSASWTGAGELGAAADLHVPPSAPCVGDGDPGVRRGRERDKKRTKSPGGEAGGSTRHLARGSRAPSGCAPVPRAVRRAAFKPSNGSSQIEGRYGAHVSPATLHLSYCSLTSRVMFSSFQDYCQQRHSRHKLNYISSGSSGEVIYRWLLFPSSPHLSVITLWKTRAPVCRCGGANACLQLCWSWRARVWKSVLARDQRSGPGALGGHGALSVALSLHPPPPLRSSRVTQRAGVFVQC